MFWKLDVHTGAVVLSLSRIPAIKWRYIAYVALMGGASGLLGFGEVVGRKSLSASPLAITVLTMIAPFAASSSLWWARLLTGRDQRKFVLLFGLAGFASVASGLALASVGHLLLIWLLYHFFVNGLFGQAENRILQQHIPPDKTGQTYGLAQSAGMVIAAITAFFAGSYMDHIAGGYRHLFGVLALFGLGAVALLGTIPASRATGEKQGLSKELVYRPLTDMLKLLKARPDFLRFETAFMLYGVAFMMLLPVLPLYLVDDLKFGYQQIGLARGTIFTLAMIITVQLFGRLFDRTTPHRMGIGIFFLLAFYPLGLLLALQFEGLLRLVLVYAAFALFGIAMSGLVVLWNLSSIRFSGGEDSNVYQSVHVYATSVRGAFAPLVGLAVMSIFGRPTALAVSSGMWILASFMMYYMRRVDIRKGDFRPLRAKMK